MANLEYLKKTAWQKFCYNFVNFFKNLPHAFANFFKKIPLWFKALGLKIASAFMEVYYAARRGDWKTRMSFVIMGFGQLMRGQILRGVMYLLFEILFILYMVFFGWKYLAKMGSLGEIAYRPIYNEAGDIIRYEYIDNSLLILLYSTMTIFFILAFVYMWYQNLRTNNVLQELLEVGKKAPTSKDDLKSLTNDQYYKTLLSIPMIGLVMFTILPIVFMILIAFTNYSQVNMPPENLFDWVGFDNFANLVGANSTASSAKFAYTFREVLLWTIIWAIFATFTNYLLGMVVALMINKKGIRFKKLWRTVLILTVAVPSFVSLLLMSQVLGDYGILNTLLKQWGIIDSSIKFLTDGVIAKITVIVVNIWIGIPYTMLMISGILMNIPADLYESAKIDGASSARMYFKITLPYMWFVTTPYVINAFVGNINNFNVIYLLTGGAPLSLDYETAGQTDLLITWLYKMTFNEQEYGMAAVIGILVFIVVAAISLVVYNRSNAIKNEEVFS